MEFGAVAFGEVVEFQHSCQRRILVYGIYPAFFRQRETLVMCLYSVRMRRLCSSEGIIEAYLAR